MGRGDSTREALIDAAATLIDERGIEGVSVREVARMAGVSSGAPFRHFADKNALMSAVAMQALERFNATLDAAAAQHEGNPLEAFRAMGIAYVKLAVANPPHFRAMHRVEYTGPEAPEPVRRAIQHMQERMLEYIKLAQAAGMMRPDDPAIILMGAHAIVYGLARMFVDGQMAAQGIGPEQAEPITHAMTDLIGRGFAPVADA